MTKIWVIALIVGIVAGSSCLSRPTAQPPKVNTPLAGSYRLGDETGYNLSLSLNTDGSYSCSWDGCLGTYGSAFGQWRFYPDRIVLDPRSETGKMKRYLRQVDIVSYEGKSYLVPHRDRAQFERGGPREDICFEKPQFYFQYP